MCGLVAVFGKNANKITIEDLNEKIIHRGPDGSGIWLNDSFDVALGHRRLAIQDISPNGHQPMLSSTGRYAIVFNGEIYNVNSLRTSINHSFRGHSDTEVILELVELHGFEKAIKLLKGMFSIVIWDVKKKELLLARDRAGEKPLYYGIVDETLYVVSDLRSLQAVAGLNLKISQTATSHFFSIGFIPSSYTVYEEFIKFPPGRVASFCLKEKKIKSTLSSYWHLSTNASQIQDQKLALKRLDSILMKAVEECLVSDVDLGVFLSGGIDSTLIASYAKQVSSKRVHSLTIGFEDKAYDESEISNKLAAKLGFQHHPILLSPDEISRQALNAIDALDIPLADMSIIPTWILSKYARKNFTVALSGDGGDELFGGYSRYSAFDLARKLPKPLLYGSIALIEKLNQKLINSAGKIVGIRNLNDKTHKLTALTISDPTEYYCAILGGNRNDIHGIRQESQASNELELLMSHDFHNYMVDDVLVKVDRASMAHSLEVRAPFLHPDVIEFSQTIPTNWKVSNNNKKIILRRLLKEKFNIEIPKVKSGFSVPPLKLVSSMEISNFVLDGNMSHLNPLPENLRREWETIVNAFKLKKWEDINPEKAWKFIVWKRWAEKNI